MLAKVIGFFTPIAEVLSVRNFALYSAGNSISLIGMWVQRLVVIWLVWELTHSNTWLGVIALSEFLPIILITPIGGVIADRFDRRTITIVSQFVAVAQALLYCILTVTSLITPEIIFLLSLIGGFIFAINNSARLALIPGMVPRQHLASAIAFTGVNFNLARFIGPALAGFIIVEWGAAAAFGFNALTYAAIIVALWFIKMPRFKRTLNGDATYFSDLVQGWRYTAARSEFATLLLLVAVGAFCARPVAELLPGFVAELFAEGPGPLSVVTSAMGLGAVFAGIWLAGKGSVSGLTSITITAILCNAGAVMIAVSTSWFWLMTAAFFIAGFSQLASGTGSQTLIQHAVDDEMRGRVMGLWSMIQRGGPAAGALLLGSLSDLHGFTRPVLIGAAIAALIALYALRRRSRLENRFERQAAPA